MHKVIGIKAHCLDGLSDRSLGWRTWLHQQLAPLLDRQEPFRLVHKYLQRVAMREGWLIDRDGFWICRFHCDEKAWISDPRVFVDHGREMPNAEQGNDGKSFCGWAGLPLTLLGVLRLSRDGSDLL